MKNKHSLKQLGFIYFNLILILVHDGVCIMASYKQKIQPTFPWKKICRFGSDRFKLQIRQRRIVLYHTHKVSSVYLI
jgi:hypothetical protein